MPEWEDAETIGGLLRFQSVACGYVGSPLYEDLLARAADDLRAGRADAARPRRARGRPQGLGAGAAPDGRRPPPCPRPGGRRRWRGATRRRRRRRAHLGGVSGDARGARGRAAAARRAPGADQRGGALRRPAAGLPRRRGAHRAGRCGCSRSAPAPASTSAGASTATRRTASPGARRTRPLRIEFELLGGAGLTASPGTVAERAGCDAAPVDPGSEEGRLTLLSYVWPDQAARMERLRAALEIAAARPAAVERSGAVEWTAARLAEPAPGRATILFHSVVMQYLSEDERDAFGRVVREAGSRAAEDTPLAWLRMEPDGDRAAVRLATWPGGEDRLLALAGYHGTPVEPRLTVTRARPRSSRVRARSRACRRSPPAFPTRRPGRRSCRCRGTRSRRRAPSS